MTKMETQDAPRVVVIMGSKSDWATLAARSDVITLDAEHETIAGELAHRAPPSGCAWT